MTALLWLILTVGSLIWYVVLLAYVAVRGASDIKEILLAASRSLPGKNDT